MASSSRTGPFTMTAGTPDPVVALSAARSNSGRLIASMAAMITGMAAGSAPAMTALTAIFSTVHSPRSGGSSATISSGNRSQRARNARTRPSVGGMSGSPSPQPRSAAQRVKTVTSSDASWRSLVSQSTSHPEGPQERSIMRAGDVTDLSLLKRVERVGKDVPPQRGAAAAAGERSGEVLEVIGAHRDRRDPGPGGAERVVDGPRGARAAVSEADDRDVDAGQELVEFLEHRVALVAGPAAGAPESHLGAVTLGEPRPFVAHPVPGPPQDVDAEADALAGEGAGVGTAAAAVGHWCERRI